MSKSASYISFCNCNNMAQMIESPPDVCLTIPFPLQFPFTFSYPFPFPSSVGFPFPFPSFLPFPFPVPFSPPHLSSPWPLSLSLPSPGWILLPLSSPGSAQFWSSSSSSIISSWFCHLTSRKSSGFYCWQRGGSIFARGSSLPYHEKCSPVGLNISKLVVCGLKWSTWSPKAQG